MRSELIITIQEKTTVQLKLQEHIGEANRIDILELCSLLGMSRRKLRAIVHEINSDDTNHLILTDTDEGGYWLADKRDSETAVNNYFSEESRALKTLEKVNAMKNKIERIYGRAALDKSARLQATLF